MHPIDYLAYRVKLSYSNGWNWQYSSDSLLPIHKAMIGVGIILSMPLLLMLLIVLFEIDLGKELTTTIIILLFVAVYKISNKISKNYYTQEKVAELNIRYKEHKLNSWPHLVIVLIYAIVGVLWSFGMSIAMAILTTHFFE